MSYLNINTIKITQYIKSFFQSTRLIDILWFAVPLFACFIKTLNPANLNNYLMYKYVFIHTKSNIDLFTFIPEHHNDINHYGIFFSLLIAPFTFLPNSIAALLYQLIQLYLLHFLIRKIDLNIVK
jgi:hypothetical protein